MVSRNVFYQDNTSAMKMLQNGCTLNGNRSKHIHTLFFTKDALQRNNIVVKYCIANQMLADFYTKPYMTSSSTHYETY